MAIFEILGALALAGLMGMVGQGARVFIGLKKLRDEMAANSPDEQDLFVASRLIVSLLYGFVAGIAAGFALGLDQIIGITKTDVSLLMGLAAAGYAGADAIEAFTSRIVTPVKGTGPGAPTLVGNTADLEASVSDVHDEVASIKSMMLECAASKTLTSAKAGDALDGVTADQVKQMFVPATQIGNITTHLPNVIQGLRTAGLADKEMLIMALATIRAETEGFRPISEGVSTFNTTKTPFDRYEPGTPAGKRLGNTTKGDGPLFKGRGFVQLTGRDNYKRVGTQLSLALISQPNLANQSDLAGRILGQFLKNNEAAIRAALAAGDIKKARKLVNGGSHGFDRFEDAFEKGKETFKDL